jgi:hypothetical protein
MHAFSFTVVRLFRFAFSAIHETPYHTMQRPVAFAATNIVRLLALLAFHRGFFLLDFNPLSFDVEAQSGENSHVHVRNQDQRKPGNQITAPIRKEKLVPRDDEESDCDVMAETVFASEEIEEFALIKPLASFALSLTQIVEFPKDLLMRDSPGDRCDRNSDDKQSHKLLP